MEGSSKEKYTSSVATSLKLGQQVYHLCPDVGLGRENGRLLKATSGAPATSNFQTWDLLDSHLSHPLRLLHELSKADLRLTPHNQFVKCQESADHPWERHSAHAQVHLLLGLRNMRRWVREEGTLHMLRHPSPLAGITTDSPGVLGAATELRAHLERILRALPRNGETSHRENSSRAPSGNLRLSKTIRWSSWAVIDGRLSTVSRTTVSSIRYTRTSRSGTREGGGLGHEHISCN